MWFDALPNYLTATGFPDDELTKRRGRRSCTSIGKDITRLHSVIWPAMLQAAGVAAAGARVGARLRAARRRAVQQVGRRAARPGRSDRSLRRRRVPLLPAARGSVRRRRHASPGSGSTSATTPISRTHSAIWRAARSRWSRSIATASCPTGARGRARSRRRGGSRRVSRGDGRHARLSCCTKRCKRVMATSTRGNEFVQIEPAVGAREGSGEARGSSRPCSRRSCASSRARRFISRRSCRRRRRSCGRRSAAPASVQRSAFRERRRRST